MAIYTGKASLLKIEEPADSDTWVTVALVTQLSINKTVPTITASGLLFQSEAQHIATGFADLTGASISASGYASDDSSLMTIRAHIHNRTAFAARFYLDATDYSQAECKITSASFSGGHNDAVQFSMTLDAVNLTESIA